MFERFTDRARRVLVLAQEEARILGHNFLGTEHLLLGLIREGDGVAAMALAQLGIRLDDVRERVDETIGPAGSRPSGSPPFTPRAKRVLELSLREALQLGHNYIGTEHILLGLVREGEGVAAQVLVNLGAELARVRQQVIQILAGYATVPPAQGGGGQPQAEAPRCARCDATLSRFARYRMIAVASDDDEPGRGPLRAILLYCGSCGTVLGPYVAVGDEFTGPLVKTMSVPVFRDVVPTRTRRFPDELLTPVDMTAVPEDARAELAYDGNQVVEGTAGGEEVRLIGRVKSHRGSLKGTWGGVFVNADWRLGDNSQAPSSVPALLTGRFAGEVVKLKGDFHLSPNYFFEQADITGGFGETPFRAVVSAADGGLGSTDAIVAEGTMGEVRFELFAARAADRTITIVRGSLDGQTVSLDATRDRPSGAVKLCGSYSGPPILLALAIGVVAYFS